MLIKTKDRNPIFENMTSNEVMRLACVDYNLATEVVLLKKLGENEVWNNEILGMQNKFLIHTNNFSGLNYLLNNNFAGSTTSFSPNFFNRTTSVAARWDITYLQPHYLIKNSKR